MDKNPLHTKVLYITRAENGRVKSSEKNYREKAGRSYECKEDMKEGRKERNKKRRKVG